GAPGSVRPRPQCVAPGLPTAASRRQPPGADGHALGRRPHPAVGPEGGGGAPDDLLRPRHRGRDPRRHRPRDHAGTGTSARPDALTTLLVRAGLVYTGAGDEVENGWILARDGMIAEGGSGQPPAAEGAVDERDCVAVPRS